MRRLVVLILAVFAVVSMLKANTPKQNPCEQLSLQWSQDIQLGQLSRVAVQRYRALADMQGCQLPDHIRIAAGW